MKIFRNGKGKLSVVLQSVYQLSYLFDIRQCTLSILYMRLYSVIAEVTKILLTLLCLTCLHPHTHSYCSICRGTEVTGCTLYITASFNVDTPSYRIVVSGFGRDWFRPLVGGKTLKLNCSSRRMVREFLYVYFTVVSL